MDSEKAENFAERLVDTLNSGAMCLMTSIGHRAGLFDTMAGMDLASSEEIARKAGLNERYVREWLGAMTTGRIIEHEPESGRYRLPPEHAAFLTRSAGADNIAVFAQYIPELGSVEDDILECFTRGGGVAYEKFNRFHAIMMEDSGQSVLPALFEHILPLIPGIEERLTAGIAVLDLGCGRGRALHMLAEHFPASRFTGLDLSPEAIGYARDAATTAGLDNLEFEIRDLTDFHVSAEPGAFDFVTTFDAVHDQAKPLNVLKGIARVLRDDGVYLMQDINASVHHHNNMDHPIGPLLYTVSCMHCMTVSLAQNGDGLGAMWGREQAMDLLEQAGFSQTDVYTLDHDIQNAYFVSRK